MKQLSQMEIGQGFRVIRIRCAEAERKRLYDLGMTLGISVYVIGKAPFGGPTLIAVRGYRLALGKGQAQRIWGVERGTKDENGRVSGEPKLW